MCIQVEVESPKIVYGTRNSARQILNDRVHGASFEPILESPKLKIM